MTRKKQTQQFVILTPYGEVTGPFTEAEVKGELGDLFSWDGDLGQAQVFTLTPVKVSAEVSISLGFPAAVPNA